VFAMWPRTGTRAPTGVMAKSRPGARLGPVTPHCPANLGGPAHRKTAADEAWESYGHVMDSRG
jgi:hypothetical protein